MPERPAPTIGYAHTCWLLLALVWMSGCVDSEKERLIATTRPTYDQSTGRLIEITYDANRDGRIDTWTEMDGTRPIQSRIDLDEDGKIDRWEYYDESGKLTKLGFSRRDDGKPDAWAIADADGKVHRIELSSTGDESRIDRWEYYDPAPGDPGSGTLVRAEEDTNDDGRPDKWETYQADAIVTAMFDENGDGIPDRTLDYQGSQVVIIDVPVDDTALPQR